MNNVVQTLKDLKEMFSNEMIRSIGELERDVLNMARENDLLKKQAAALEGSIKTKDSEIKSKDMEIKRLNGIIAMGIKK